MRIIHKEEIYRIIEVPYEFFDLDDLKGDCFEPEHNPDVSPEVLEREERDFEQKVEREGVYGYILQAWNHNVDMGWEDVDSCFGFVGEHDNSKASEFHHYIVDEFKDYISKNQFPKH